MPNTASAERRMRSSARRHARNKSTRASLKTIEKRYDAALASGNRESAGTALRAITSAFDKAAKAGVVHRATADRRKSRLALRLTKAYPESAEKLV
jgi:small subunit ribosomal protein S20